MGEWHLRSPKRIAFARVVLAGLGGFIALGAAFAVVPSASNFLLRFVSDSAENVTRYRNAAFDRVVTAAERQLTLAARYAGYGEAEALLLRDVPLIPLWAGNSHRLVARRVRGWVDHPGHSHQSRYLSLAG